MFKFVPLVIFAALIGFLAKGLTLNPRELPSALLDQPAPNFSLPTLLSAKPEFSSSEMLGQVWLLNIWASWCVACVSEHPLIMQLADREKIPIIGLNYKDTPEAAVAWINRFGNPYGSILDDRDGLVGIDWGVYGVPETFIMDRSGQVRYKHVGPIDDVAMRDIVLPLIDKLLASPS